MNDPRHPVQPAPASPGHPRPAPAAAAAGNGAPVQQMPRAAGTPAAAQQQRPAHAPHAPHAPPQQQQVARPMSAPPQPHAPRPTPPPIPAQGLPRPGGGQTINPAAHAPSHADEEAIALVDDMEDDLAPAPAPGTPSKIKFGADIGIKKHAWKRQVKPGGMGACRVRTFHGKLSDQGLEYIDEAINVWLDDHPEIDIKLVTTNVGMFDGKFKDLALIVNVWY